MSSLGRCQCTGQPTLSHFGGLASLLVPNSTGIGLNTPAVSAALLAATRRDDQAVVATALALWRRIGSLLGGGIQQFSFPALSCVLAEPRGFRAPAGRR